MIMKNSMIMMRVRECECLMREEKIGIEKRVFE